MSKKNIYNNRKWRKLRLYHISNNPLCAYCYPKIVEATQVDHCIPFDLEDKESIDRLFLEEDNLISTCSNCHGLITFIQQRLDFKDMSFEEAKRFKISKMVKKVGDDGFY